jgi:hypothetical protein
MAASERFKFNGRQNMFSYSSDNNTISVVLHRASTPKTTKQQQKQWLFVKSGVKQYFFH